MIISLDNHMKISIMKNGVEDERYNFQSCGEIESMHEFEVGGVI